MGKNDEVLASKLIDLSLGYLREADQLYLDSLFIREKLLRSELASKYQDEPLAFFKKKHQAWEREIQELDSELASIYKKVEDVISDFEQ